MKHLFLSHVQDVGRENNKAVTTVIDLATNKVIKVYKTLKPTKFNEVSPSFKEKDIPVYAIRKRNGDTVGEWKYYISGNNSFSNLVEDVISVVKPDGDENVIPNLPTFCIMDLMLNTHETFVTLKEKFKTTIQVTIALTKKMRDLPISNHVKQEMLTTQYETMFYPKGLSNKTTDFAHTFSFKYDVSKDLADNTSVQFNVQGSQSAIAYLYDNDKHEYIPNIVGATGFIENVDPNITETMRKFIEQNFNMDYVSIDMSSREMTINLVHKNKARFDSSKTIDFGSYNVFVEMKNILSKIVETKRMEIDWIKSEYYKDATIHNERMTKNLFGSNKLDKSTYKMSEIYEMAYNNLHDKIYNKILTEYKNLISFMPEINPQFVVLCGGGIYSNHGKQSPFVKIATELTKHIFGKEIKDDKECYKYILPHGLYPIGDNKYIIKYEDYPEYLQSHVLGTALYFITNVERASKGKKK